MEKGGGVLLLWNVPGAIPPTPVAAPVTEPFAREGDAVPELTFVTSHDRTDQEDPIIDATTQYLRQVKAPVYVQIGEKAKQALLKKQDIAKPATATADKYVNDGNVDLYTPELLAKREALTASPKIVSLIDQMWLMCRAHLPSNAQRLLKAFLERQNVPARRTNSPQRRQSGSVDPENVSGWGVASRDPVINEPSFAETESKLWGEGVVTKRLYDSIHRRFLIALAPLGTAVSQSEVRSVIESDWAADVGVTSPAVPSLPTTSAAVEAPEEAAVPDGYIGGENDNGGSVWASFIDWMSTRLRSAAGGHSPRSASGLSPPSPKPRPKSSKSPGKKRAPSAGSRLMTPRSDDEGVPTQDGKRPISKTAAKLMMMNKRMFFASMFSITDIWTASVTEQEYVRFLTFLMRKLEPVSDWKPSSQDPDNDIIRLMTMAEETETLMKAHKERFEAEAQQAEEALIAAGKAEYEASKRRMSGGGGGAEGMSNVSDGPAGVRPDGQPSSPYACGDLDLSRLGGVLRSHKAVADRHMPGAAGKLGRPAPTTASWPDGDAMAHDHDAAAARQSRQSSEGGQLPGEQDDEAMGSEAGSQTHERASSMARNAGRASHGMASGDSGDGAAYDSDVEQAGAAGRAAGGSTDDLHVGSDSTEANGAESVTAGAANSVTGPNKAGVRRGSGIGIGIAVEKGKPLDMSAFVKLTKAKLPAGSRSKRKSKAPSVSRWSSVPDIHRPDAESLGHVSKHVEHKDAFTTYRLKRHSADADDSGGSQAELDPVVAEAMAAAAAEDSASEEERADSLEGSVTEIEDNVGAMLDTESPSGAEDTSGQGDKPAEEGVTSSQPTSRTRTVRRRKDRRKSNENEAQRKDRHKPPGKSSARRGRAKSTRRATSVKKQTPTEVPAGKARPMLLMTGPGGKSRVLSVRSHSMVAIVEGVGSLDEPRTRRAGFLKPPDVFRYDSTAEVPEAEPSRADPSPPAAKEPAAAQPEAATSTARAHNRAILTRHTTRDPRLAYTDMSKFGRALETAAAHAVVPPRTARPAGPPTVRQSSITVAVVDFSASVGIATEQPKSPVIKYSLANELAASDADVRATARGAASPGAAGRLSPREAVRGNSSRSIASSVGDAPKLSFRLPRGRSFRTAAERQPQDAPEPLPASSRTPRPPSSKPPLQPGHVSRPPSSKASTRIPHLPLASLDHDSSVDSGGLHPWQDSTVQIAAADHARAVTAMSAGGGDDSTATSVHSAAEYADAMEPAHVPRQVPSQPARRPTTTLGHIDLREARPQQLRSMSLATSNVPEYLKAHLLQGKPATSALPSGHPGNRRLYVPGTAARRSKVEDHSQPRLAVDGGPLERPTDIRDRIVSAPDLTAYQLLAHHKLRFGESLARQSPSGVNVVTEAKSSARTREDAYQLPPTMLSLDLPTPLHGLDPLYGHGVRDVDRMDILDQIERASRQGHRAPNHWKEGLYWHERAAVPVSRPASAALVGASGEQSSRFTTPINGPPHTSASRSRSPATGQYNARTTTPVSLSKIAFLKSPEALAGLPLKTTYSDVTSGPTSLQGARVVRALWDYPLARTNRSHSPLARSDAGATLARPATRQRHSVAVHSSPFDSSLGAEMHGVLGGGFRTFMPGGVSVARPTAFVPYQRLGKALKGWGGNAAAWSDQIGTAHPASGPSPTLLQATYGRPVTSPNTGRWLQSSSEPASPDRGAPLSLEGHRATVSPSVGVGHPVAPQQEAAGHATNYQHEGVHSVSSHQPTPSPQWILAPKDNDVRPPAVTQSNDTTPGLRLPSFAPRASIFLGHRPFNVGSRLWFTSASTIREILHSIPFSAMQPSLPRKRSPRKLSPAQQLQSTPGSPPLSLRTVAEAEALLPHLPPERRRILSEHLQLLANAPQMHFLRYKEGGEKGRSPPATARTAIEQPVSSPGRGIIAKSLRGSRQGPFSARRPQTHFGSAFRTPIKGPSPIDIGFSSSTGTRDERGPFTPGLSPSSFASSLVSPNHAVNSGVIPSPLRPHHPPPPHSSLTDKSTQEARMIPKWQHSKPAAKPQRVGMSPRTAGLMSKVQHDTATASRKIADHSLHDTDSTTVPNRQSQTASSAAASAASTSHEIAAVYTDPDGSHSASGPDSGDVDVSYDSNSAIDLPQVPQTMGGVVTMM